VEALKYLLGSDAFGRDIANTDRWSGAARGSPDHDLRGKALAAFRASVQAVFQDPSASLDPGMTVGRSIGENRPQG
jgi:ABC-type dipeptide/oligopeptide/nickel transport system ATPase subunit